MAAYSQCAAGDAVDQVECGAITKPDVGFHDGCFRHTPSRPPAVLEEAKARLRALNSWELELSNRPVKTAQGPQSPPSMMKDSARASPVGPVSRGMPVVRVR